MFDIEQAKHSVSRKKIWFFIFFLISLPH